MSIELFEKAKKAADAGDYSTALSLYQLAGRIFGEQSVAFNIRRCQSKRAIQSLQLAPDIHVLIASDSNGIKHILPSLNTLLNQSLPPKEIILHLHKESACDTGISLDSADLKEIKALPNVRIFWSEEYDPFILFNSFLSKHFDCEVTDDKLFLCCSDNQLYPPDFLESLYTEYLISGNVIASNCKLLSETADELPISSFPNFQFGALFATNFFNQDVCDFHGLDKVENIDAESWLTWHALLNGVELSDLNVFHRSENEKSETTESQIRCLKSLELLMVERYGFNVSSLYSLARELSA